MKNPRFANAQHRGVLLDYDDDSGTLFVDGGPLLARVAAGEFGPIAPFVPHVPEQPSIAGLAMAKLDTINNAKNDALDAGFLFTIGEGEEARNVRFDSDAKARLAYLELAVKLGQDKAYSTHWKASRGQWVTMNAALFMAIQPAYEAHIQACFGWQAAREQEVAAAMALAVDDEAEGLAALAKVSEEMV